MLISELKNWNMLSMQIMLRKNEDQGVFGKGYSLSKDTADFAAGLLRSLALKISDTSFVARKTIVTHRG